MYFGFHETVVKQKNRITFPAKLRKQTGDALVFSNWFEDSVLILPKKEWELFFSKLFNDQNYLLPEARDLDRFVHGGSFEIELDMEGRFVLPSYLKEFSKIEKEIVFLGGSFYIQLWDKKRLLSANALTQIQLKEKARELFKQLKGAENE